MPKKPADQAAQEKAALLAQIAELKVLLEKTRQEVLVVREEALKQRERAEEALFEGADC